MPTLKEALTAPERLKGEFVFLPAGSRAWNLDTECHSLDLKEVTPEEDVDDDAELPDLARQLGLRAVLSTTDFVGVVRNARAQRPSVSASELFRALQHYLENDAFLELQF